MDILYGSDIHINMYTIGLRFEVNTGTVLGGMATEFLEARTKLGSVSHFEFLSSSVFVPPCSVVSHFGIFLLAARFLTPPGGTGPLFFSIRAIFLQNPPTLGATGAATLSIRALILARLRH